MGERVRNISKENRSYGQLHHVIKGFSGKMSASKKKFTIPFTWS